MSAATLRTGYEMMYRKISKCVASRFKWGRSCSFISIGHLTYARSASVSSKRRVKSECGLCVIYI
jgi:hypothetical protein